MLFARFVLFGRKIEVGSRKPPNHNHLSSIRTYSFYILREKPEKP
jgi:hypothetical protein